MSIEIKDLFISTSELRLLVKSSKPGEIPIKVRINGGVWMLAAINISLAGEWVKKSLPFTPPEELRLEASDADISIEACINHQWVVVSLT